MSHTPARATPRPLFDLLSDALIELLEPRARAVPCATRPTPARIDRYALFDVPTYQRRRMRIQDLDQPDADGANR